MIGTSLGPYRIEAEQGYRASLDVWREIGDPGGMASTLVSLGALLARAGRTDEATAHLNEADEIAREAAAPAPLVLAACNLAVFSGGDPAPAQLFG